ncbi:hypothetical protein [Kordia jejudonensis]|uniref:hypothetical protein n=1 Tax=Kordia jejudonensis TaxID=1348245 RepID=UPI0012E0A697|nr:hypothetical protein [Kordia jejudonensis]
MRNILCLMVLVLTFGCAESEKKVYIEEFEWTLHIPANFKDVPSKTRMESQKKGVKMIESAYPNTKVNIVAQNLFHFNNGKYNSMNAQFSELNSEQDFLEQFNKSNEIVLKAFTKERPNTKIEKNVGTEIIDGLEFKMFNLKTLNDNGTNYDYTVYSRMFGKKQLEIIILSSDSEKRKLIDKSILASTFN